VADVVLDTSVASFLFLNRPERIPYLVHLINCRAVISFQTVAEMRFGALRANWGTARQALLERFLSNDYIVDSSDALSDAWAAIMLDA
jgi:predicted nucleic acid-binding protein